MAAPSFSGAGWRPAVLLSSTRQQHALQPAACRKDALTQAAHGKQQAHLDGLQQAGQRALAGEGGGDAALAQLLGQGGQVRLGLWRRRQKATARIVGKQKWSGAAPQAAGPGAPMPVMGSACKGHV